MLKPQNEIVDFLHVMPAWTVFAIPHLAFKQLQLSENTVPNARNFQVYIKCAKNSFGLLIKHMRYLSNIMSEHKGFEWDPIKFCEVIWFVYKTKISNTLIVLLSSVEFLPHRFNIEPSEMSCKIYHHHRLMQSYLIN